MSWYRESGYTWKQKYPVVIDNTGGSVSTIDATFTIPTTIDAFWTGIDTSGNEIRVTAADGTTKLTYKWTGFSKTNRTGTMQIDGFSAPGVGMCVVWIYWDATGAPDGAAGSVTIAAAKSGYVVDLVKRGIFVQVREQRAGDVRPATKFQKGSDETRKVLFDFSGMLGTRVVTQQGHFEADEIQWFTYTIYTGGSAYAGGITAANSRLLPGNIVQVDAKAGVDGTDYVVIPEVHTVDGEVFTGRAWLSVRDQDEA